MKDAPKKKLTLNKDSEGNKTDELGFVFEPIKGFPNLNWRGKRPYTMTRFFPAQLKEIHGAANDGWRNKLYWGDSLQVLSHLLKEFRKKIHLIYIDPPFDSKAEYSRKIQLRNKEVRSDQGAFEEKQYADLWANDEYLQFMYERLVLARELLADSGSIFVHCDRHRNHLIRCVLDEIFGNGVEESKPGLQNEIIWFYPDSPGRPANRFAPKHDTIFWYSKGSQWHFDADAVQEPILAASKKRYESTRYLINSQGKRFEYSGGEASEFKTPESVWRIPVVKGNSGESADYPTQKPEALLERMILATSRPDEVVLDFFCGSGTTLAVAQRHGRRFIGADINLGAIQTTTKRLLRKGRQMDIGGQPHGFECLTVNHYDIFRNPVEARDLLLDALQVNRLERGSSFDGEKDGRLVKVMPVNRIACRADLNEVISALDFKSFERRYRDHPNQAVEKITLICMGHEPDLGAFLQHEVKPYKLDVQVVDVLRDGADLQFKREATARVVVAKRQLVVERFYPMNLLQKLSLNKDGVKDWRELVESVMVDWNYDGAVFQPSIVDVPDEHDLVKGTYEVPDDAGTIRVKITDVLSESWERNVSNG